MAYALCAIIGFVLGCAATVGASLIIDRVPEGADSHW